MRFFRKIEIAKPKKQNKIDNEYLSKGTIKPLGVINNKLYAKNNFTEKKTIDGIQNEGFKIDDEKITKVRKEEEDVVAEKLNNAVLTEELPPKETTNESDTEIKKCEEHSPKSGEEKDEKEDRNKNTNLNTNRHCFSRQKIRERLRFLTRPNFIHCLTLCLLGASTYCIIYSIAGKGFLPGSQLFSLLVLFVLAYVSGELIKIIKLPPLLGMLLMGLLLRNVGFIHLEGVYVEVAAVLREIALCIILIRAGLGLDPQALKSLKYVILRLASVPGIAEGTLTMIVTHFVLDLPWLWGMLAGAILAAVSPAVVIPCLFSLQERGYGTRKGIPTLVVAAASLDDIIAITIFGVILNIIYSTGYSLPMQILQGPLGILIGVVFGVAWGFVARFFPHQNDSQVVLLRVLIIAGGGLMAIVGTKAVDFQGAGPLGCIIAAFVACLGWRKQNYTSDYNPVASVFRIVWLVFQPILFSLVGAEVDISVLELSTVGNCLLVLCCCLAGRIIVTVFVAFGVGFTWREKIFISLAWFPKATVQAALGPLVLDTARHKGSEDDIAFASKVLILAVLAILITAPIGAALISTLGTKLLTKDEKKTAEELQNVNDANLEATKEDSHTN